jgi:hypothetical protein
MKLLMAHRGRPGEEEAEPVLVEIMGSRAILKLDDGEGVEFDLGELREVLGANGEHGTRLDTAPSIRGKPRRPDSSGRLHPQTD